MSSPLFEVRPRDGGFGVRDLRQDPDVWLDPPGMPLGYWWPSKAPAEEYAAKREAAAAEAARAASARGDWAPGAQVHPAPGGYEVRHVGRRQ